MFWINALTSSVNANLNYQSNKVLNDYTPPYSKSLTANSNTPYLNLDGLIIYNLSKSSNSNIFLHASFFTNIVNPSSSHAYNNYYMLQGGYSVDFNSLFSKLSNKKTN